MRLTNAKEFLKQYEDVEKEIYYIEKELKQLKESYDQVKSVTDYDGMPHGANIGHPTEQRAIRVADTRLKYVDLLNKAIDKRAEVFNVIIQISGTERDVLYARYINLHKWEKVCLDVGLEWTMTHEYHKRALKKVQKILDTE